MGVMEASEQASGAAAEECICECACMCVCVRDRRKSEESPEFRSTTWHDEEKYEEEEAKCAKAMGGCGKTNK